MEFYLKFVITHSPVQLVSHDRAELKQTLLMSGIYHLPSSPEGRAPVRRKATTKWTGRATWRPTLPGYGSTWASLAGSCTTGRIPTWPGWLTTWQRSVSSVPVSKWGGAGRTGERTDWRRGGARGEPTVANEGYAVRKVEDYQWYHYSLFDFFFSLF